MGSQRVGHNWATSLTSLTHGWYRISHRPLWEGLSELIVLPSHRISDLESEVKVLVAQSCPTLHDPMDYSPPGSFVHGILQARILEWVAIPFSRESPQPRNWTWVSCNAVFWKSSLKTKLSCQARCYLQWIQIQDYWFLLHCSFHFTTWPCSRPSKRQITWNMNYCCLFSLFCSMSIRQII